jgi:hypothetical protein
LLDAVSSSDSLGQGKVSSGDFFLETRTSKRRHARDCPWTLSTTAPSKKAEWCSGFLVSKEGQQKIADLDNVVVRKDVEPKIAVDRSKLRVIDPAEGNRIDLLHGFDK